MKTAKPNNRRKFLLAAGLGGAGAVAAVATGTGKPAAASAAAVPSGTGPSGYHVSEHILKYYKTTEV